MITLHNSASAAANYADTLGWTDCQFGETTYATAGEAVLACHAAAAAALDAIRTLVPAHASRSAGLHAGRHAAGRFLCWPVGGGRAALETW